MAVTKKLIKIGDLARLTNRTVRALRLYEEVGVLVPVERSDGGYRMYDASNIERLEYIDRLQRLGLSLNEICGLVDDWSDGASPREAMSRVRTVYRDKLNAVREKIKDLRALEQELVESLVYLERCTACAHAAEKAESGCGPCIKKARVVEPIPNLIAGLTAH
jgi:MerR family transcriptional regulator, copper efflux regulator